MIGVQLYAFQRTVIDDDLVSVLTELRAMGYDAIEGYPGHMTNYRKTLDALGMQFAASHTTPTDLQQTAPFIEYLNVMGSADVCCSGPIGWNDRSYDNFRATCEFLNARGRILKDAGIALHYHNHEFEFLPVRDGMTAMDVLLRELDFEVVDLCADVGWIWRAGLDPSDFLRKHAAKITYVHLRDFAGADSVPLGKGQVDLAAVMAAVRVLPRLRWLVVEHDPVSKTPAEDLAQSRHFLRDRFNL